MKRLLSLAATFVLLSEQTTFSSSLVFDEKNAYAYANTNANDNTNPNDKSSLFDLEALSSNKRDIPDLITREGFFNREIKESIVSSSWGKLKETVPMDVRMLQQQDNVIFNFTLVLVFDRFPAEIGWILEYENGTVLEEAPVGTYANSLRESTVTEAIVVTKEGLFNFTVLDSNGDGLCCNFGSGSYVLYFGNNETGMVLARGSEFGESESTVFVAPPPYMPPDFNITIVIYFDNSPEHTGWSLAFENGTVVDAVAPGAYQGLVVTETVGVKPGSYVFTILDSASDGICCFNGTGNYTVYVGDVATGEVVAQGFEFKGSESTSFDVVDPDAPSVQPTVLVSDMPSPVPTMPAPSPVPTVTPPRAAIYRAFASAEGRESCDTVPLDIELDCIGSSDRILLFGSGQTSGECVYDGPTRLRCRAGLGGFIFVDFACEGQDGTALLAEGTFFEQMATCLQEGGQTVQLMGLGITCFPSLAIDFTDVVSCTGNSVLGMSSDGNEYCISGFACGGTCEATIPSFRTVVNDFPQECLASATDIIGERPPTPAPAAPPAAGAIAYKVEYLYFAPQGSCTNDEVVFDMTCGSGDNVSLLEVADPSLVNCSLTNSSSTLSCTIFNDMFDSTFVVFGCEGPGDLLPTVSIDSWGLKCGSPGGLYGLAFLLEVLCDYSDDRGLETRSGFGMCVPETANFMQEGSVDTFCVSAGACDGTCNSGSTPLKIVVSQLPEECIVPTLPTLPPIIAGPFVTITIAFDNFPAEVGWELVSDVVVASAPVGTYSNMAALSTVVERVPLDFGTYTFTITDTGGDGICCGFGSGSYTVEFLDEVLADGARFGASESTVFTIAETTVAPSIMDSAVPSLPPPTVLPSDAPSLVPTLLPTTMAPTTMAPTTSNASNNHVHWILLSSITTIMTFVV